MRAACYSWWFDEYAHALVMRLASGLRADAWIAFYQLFIVTGVMLSFWINYGALLHFEGVSTFAVPLALQALPAV
jgi:hypothetical protein